MVVSGIGSGVNSGAQGDQLGVGLAFMGFFPVIGIYASATSVIRDLSSGVYEVKPFGPPEVPWCGINYPYLPY
jgi:hypothetical protein